MYYVYVLESQDDKSRYIGYSENLKQRVSDHLNKKGARLTRQKSDWQLIYYEAYQNQQDALGRERFLKSGAGWRYLKKQLFHHLQKPL